MLYATSNYHMRYGIPLLQWKWLADRLLLSWLLWIICRDKTGGEPMAANKEMSRKDWDGSSSLCQGTILSFSWTKWGKQEILRLLVLTHTESDTPWISKMLYLSADLSGSSITIAGNNTFYAFSGYQDLNQIYLTHETEDNTTWKISL